MYYTLCETFLDISQALIPSSDFRTFRRVIHKDLLQCVSEQIASFCYITPCWNNADVFPNFYMAML